MNILKCIILLLMVYGSLLAEESGDVNNLENVEKSEATFDKRLPPVFPGETISDGKRKMKVWSTAGPVPVSSINTGNINVNQNQNRRGSRGNQPINVIVDKRN